MSEHDDKTLEATPHRRQQARQQGQVVRSQDLASALVLIGALVALGWLGPSLAEFFAALADEHLGGQAWLSVDDDFVVSRWLGIVAALAAVLLPMLGLLLLWNVAANLMQVGLLFLPQKLAPDISRIDPIRGFSRLFSLLSTVRMGFGILKIIVIGAVAYACLRSEQGKLLSLGELAVPQIAAYLFDTLFWMAMKMAVAMLLLAVFDYAFQWWKHEQDLRMTPQEAREEMKNLQGDPRIAARRKQVQRQLVLQRLKTAVTKADCIVTNPTELAVAIEYKPETMPAPVVVAQGAGAIAQHIRRLALEQGITIVERKPLARMLYQQVAVDRPIPQAMHTAVAEVLAYAYQLRK